MNDQKIQDYQTTVIAVAMIAGAIHELDIPGILTNIGYAEVFGPLSDPTLWREKREAMEEDRKLLQAAMPLWQWAQEAEKRENA